MAPCGGEGVVLGEQETQGVEGGVERFEERGSGDDL